MLDMELAARSEAFPAGVQSCFYLIILCCALVIISAMGMGILTHSILDLCNLYFKNLIIKRLP